MLCSKYKANSSHKDSQSGELLIQFLRAFTKLKHIKRTKYLQITKTNVDKCAVLKILITLKTMLVLPHDCMHVIFVLLLSQSDT